MKIAVNTRLLLPQRLEGIGTFTHQVLKQLVADHPNDEFLFIFDRKWSSEFIYADNITPIQAGPQARHPFLYYIWFEYIITQLLNKYQPDVFLSPDGYLSLRSNIPQVAVIHDLNFEHFPHFFDPFHRWHYRTFFPKYSQKAKRIATVSEFSKKDISELYNIPIEKIDVIYNGVDALYKPADKNAIDEFKKKITGNQDYFVFIGGLYLRKNLYTILKAFDAFKKKTHSQVKFVLAGKSYNETEELFKLHQTLESKEDILFLGRVEPREQIPVILSGALSLVYVSLFEGFGLPIAEAMQCGTPVITGNITAMPEIAGDAAILADPYDHLSIAQAMEKITSSEKLRSDLRRKGFEQVKKFTWKQTAERLWNTIQTSVEK